MTPAQVAKVIAALPQLLDVYETFEAALLATKGEASLPRDFDVLIALAPKLKALAVTIQAATAATPAA